MAYRSERVTIAAGLSSSVRQEFVLVLALILLGMPNTARSGNAPGRWLSFEPAVVELEGVVKIEFKYGPPNFGENPKTDQKMHIPILELTEPINVRGDPASELNSETKEAVKEVQLKFLRRQDYQQARRCKGRHVTVSGTLTSALLGTDFREVIMNVAEVKWCESQQASRMLRPRAHAPHASPDGGLSGRMGVPRKGTESQ
jgi:hypothetical protein